MKTFQEKKNNFLQYLIAVTAACLVFGIMQGTKDNYGIMMNGIIGHTGISYVAVSFTIGIGQIMYGVTQPLFAMLALKKSNTYWCLLIGFSTCGFHMSIIETHLFSQYLSAGIPGGITSLALTVYGISTMLGAVGTGFLGQRFRMKNVLASVYGIRILIAVLFIFLPKTILFAFLATAALGLTGDSTVPPTTGIISSKVGIAKMAVLYGSLCIGHQIGAFASAWLGGILVSTPLSYTALWIADLCLCSLASFASFLIKD